MNKSPSASVILTPSSVLCSAWCRDCCYSVKFSPVFNQLGACCYIQPLKCLNTLKVLLFYFYFKLIWFTFDISAFISFPLSYLLFKHWTYQVTETEHLAGARTDVARQHTWQWSQWEVIKWLIQEMMNVITWLSPQEHDVMNIMSCVTSRQVNIIRNRGFSHYLACARLK